MRVSQNTCWDPISTPTKCQPRILRFDRALSSRVFRLLQNFKPFKLNTNGTFSKRIYDVSGPFFDGESESGVHGAAKIDWLELWPVFGFFEILKITNMARIFAKRGGGNF